LDINPLHFVFVVIAMGFAVAIPVIYIFLGFSAVRLLRDIRDTLREKQSAG
jgi:hypothetical protein